MSLPCVVVMCVKTVLSAFDPWGTNTTSEKSVRREASAASTLSPALTSEIGFTPPDSSVTVSVPAKHAFNEGEVEVEEKDDAVAAVVLERYCPPAEPQFPFVAASDPMELPVH
jgi:hypothetical protein